MIRCDKVKGTSVFWNLIFCVHVLFTLLEEKSTVVRVTKFCDTQFNIYELPFMRLALFRRFLIKFPSILFVFPKRSTSMRT